MGLSGLPITCHRGFVPTQTVGDNPVPGYFGLLITATVFFHFIGEAGRRSGHWHLFQSEMGKHLVPLWPPVDASHYARLTPLGSQAWPPRHKTTKTEFENLASMFNPGAAARLN